MVAIIAFGASLAFSASTLRENTIEVGRGLFVSGLLALALLWLENNLDDRERQREREEDRRSRVVELRQQQTADRQALQVTIGLRSELRGIDLRGRELDGFHLAAKDLRGAQLEEGSARRANFTDTRLSGARLAEADFRDSLMAKAVLTTPSTPSDPSLDSRESRDALFEIYAAPAADSPLVSSTDFSFTDLTSARLLGLVGSNTNFSHAWMERANLSWADLKSPKFRSARLVRATVRHARLNEADFRGANLYGVDLSLDRAASVEGCRLQ